MTNSLFVPQLLKRPFAIKPAKCLLMAVVFSICFISAGAQTVLEVGESKTFSPGNYIPSAEVSDGSIISFTYIHTNSQTTGVKVTALKPGTAVCKVNYYYNNALQSTSYTIEVIDLRSIIIPQSLTLKLGDSYTFTPVVQDSRMQKYLLEWRCEDSNIATINSDWKEPILSPAGIVKGYNYLRGGKLEAKNPGSTRVICTYKGLSAICQLNVEPVYVSDINFAKQEYELTAYQSMNIAPEILPSDATSKDITWKSTNPSVAIVDNSGNVLGVNKGKAVITATATDGSMTMGTYIVVVKPEENDEVDIDFKIDNYAQFSTKVERNSPFTLNIQSPSPDWKIESFSINGANALGELTNGIYAVDYVETSMNIGARFAYDGELKFYDLTSGIESAVDNSTIRISKAGNQLYITDIKPGSNLKIYTTGGMLIGSHECLDTSLKVELASNIYIIVLDNISFKIKI